jgi:hypothetical protein
VFLLITCRVVARKKLNGDWIGENGCPHPPYPPTTMTGFVRRAQRKVQKAEARLEAARAELARQIQLDVERLRLRAERAAAKKEAKRARFAANPQLAIDEIYPMMLRCCMEHMIRYHDSMPRDFLEWKKATKFPPKTNLYEKVERFVEETVIGRAEKPIPIVAKLMTGDLIPMEYHEHHTKHYHLKQLEKLSPEEFPFGTVNFTRLCEDTKEPVKEGDVFGLFQNGAKLVSYFSQLPHERTISWLFDKQYGHAICYYFMIQPVGIRYESGRPAVRSHRVGLYYFPREQLVTTNTEIPPIPLDQLGNTLRTAIIGYQWQVEDPFMLTEDAQADLCAVFDVVRMEL